MSMVAFVPTEIMETWTQERSIADDLPLRVSPDGLTVYSFERNRFYTRKFNHDYARELHDLGYTYAEIARTFGVVTQAIAVALDPVIARKVSDRARRSGRTACEACGGPTLKADHSSRRINDGRALCGGCRSRARRTTIRFQRDGSFEIRCRGCKQWFPPDEYGGGPRFRDIRDEGFHGNCRGCNTKARGAYRDRHRVPCEGGCGKMVEGRGRATRPGVDPDRPYLCKDCWHKVTFA